MITKEDLLEFRTSLLEELRGWFQRAAHSSQERKWIKSYEVRAMLGISAGTLHNMRSSGKIAYSRIGGLIFYSYDDVVQVMTDARKCAKNTP